MKKNLLLLALLGIMLTGCGSEPVEVAEATTKETEWVELKIPESTVAVEQVQEAGATVEDGVDVEMTEEALSKATINGREFNFDVPIEKAIFECIEDKALVDSNYRIISSSEDKGLSYYFPNTYLLVIENEEKGYIFYEDGTSDEIKVSRNLFKLPEEQLLASLTGRVSDFYYSSLTQDLDIEEEIVLEKVHMLMGRYGYTEVEIIDYPDGVVSAHGVAPCYYVLCDGTTIYGIWQETGSVFEYGKTLEEFEEYKKSLQK